MKVSLSWLRDYVPITLDPKTLADALTMSGLEVDAMWDRYAFLDKILVARVLEVSPHPNATKLTCCTVSTGSKVFSVVCGAPNVAKGILVPLATPGAVLPSGMEIKVGVLRGETSEGMLCSADELGLEGNPCGLMVLPEDTPLGVPLNQALSISDMVLEIGLTPNRPDCASVLGIAREVAAIQNTPVTAPVTPVPDMDGEISTLTSVTIDSPDLCPRYAAKLLSGITIGESPAWLKDRLLSVGQRPINNIVDVTNFVMLEMGQPLHAFDFDHLAENRIVVRTAKEGEPFTTLDGKARTLSSDMLLICDAAKPIAIAGVMGGANSEIKSTTTQVLIESAYFAPESVRKTAKKLGLSTDASYRFERGIDPKGTLTALLRAADLMVQVAGGAPVPGIIDAHPAPVPSRSISLTADAVNGLLGTRLEREEIIRLLAGLDIRLISGESSEEMLFSVPSYRVDLSIPEDLVEEVARRHGYENIPTTLPLQGKTTSSSQAASLRDFRESCRDKMVGFGFHEAINYSFIHPGSCDNLGLLKEDRRRDVIPVLNPLSEDQGIMRPSLLPGLLESMKRNLSKQIKTLRFFEVGKVFLGQGGGNLPEEDEMLAALWTGDHTAPSWSAKPVPCDFYDLKGVLEGLLAALGIPEVRFTRASSEEAPYLRPGHSARITLGETVLGVIGELHPKILPSFGLKQTAFIFELHFSRLLDLRFRAKIGMVSRFPFVARDTTLILSREIEAHRLIEAVQKMESALVEGVHLFDVFEGNPIPEGKRSISFRITYRSGVQTLEDETVNGVHSAICEKLIKEFQADLP